MDILAEIKKEHEAFKELIASIENAKGDKKKKLFEEFYAKLVGHHEAEEHVLFEDVKEKSDDEGKKIVMEMIEEHNLADLQFKVVQKTPLTDETWDAKFSVLKEVLTHHMDEEEKMLFKQAKKVLDKATLTEKYEPFETAMEKYKEKQEKKLNAKKEA